MRDILQGKRILAVDDEPDVLEIIQELLEVCAVMTASNYEQAEGLLLKHSFDLVLLDIVGVNGFALLETCTKRGFPAAMLTAHSLNIDNISKAVLLGAVSFLPKGELANLEIHLAEIFEGLAEGRTHWRKLFDKPRFFFRERQGMSRIKYTEA
ncbi:MAG TPA: response regulator [Desulfomonilaceae bacterium]|nr:response regulator [Desulfomonilaceae bacterium]